MLLDLDKKINKWKIYLESMTKWIIICVCICVMGRPRKLQRSTLNAYK